MASYRHDASWTRRQVAVVTPEEIARAEELGACNEALDWLSEEPRDWSVVVERYPQWLLRYAADKLTPEQLDRCEELAPGAALSYAARRLSSEQLDRCAEQAPWLALFYAANRLTPERLDWCAERQPRAALEFASRLLTPERLVWCRTHHKICAAWNVRLLRCAVRTGKENNEDSK